MVVFEEIGRDSVVSIDGSNMREGVESWTGYLDWPFYSSYGEDPDRRSLSSTCYHSLPRWLELEIRLILLFNDALLGDFHHFPEMAHP